MLLLACSSWQGRPAACAEPAAPLAVEVEEDLPDMNALRAKAEGGRATAQTHLADLCLASADFTNAVFWYRKAAEQGDVPAQLALAACLVSGRGTQKNPAEAARLLRQAADLIETGNSRPPLVSASVQPATNTVTSTGKKETPAGPGPALLTKTSPAGALTTPAEMPSRVAQTSLGRVERSGELLTAEPVLQETSPVFRPTPLPGNAP